VVALDTLRYLARTSRIPQVAALVSSLLDLKPIVCVDRGEVRPLERVRSRQRSLEHLLGAVGSALPTHAPVHLAVHHARAADAAVWLLDELCRKLNVVESYVTEFTPIMGAYCGPGLVGAAFYPDAAD
jgi:DegV family protein with EDD domain